MSLLAFQSTDTCAVRGTCLVSEVKLDLYFCVTSSQTRSLLLGLLCLCSTEGRCIFDQVQQSVRVVSPLNGSSHTKNSGVLGHLGAQNRYPEQTMSIHQYARWGRGTSRQSFQSHRVMRQDRRTTAPIRIRTWIPRESMVLSVMDRGRLDSAINQTVSMVSGLLSVRPSPGPLLLSRDINKYCKFIWKNESAANFNRCGRASSNYRNETCLDVVIPDEHLRGCAVFHLPDSPVSTELRREGAGLEDTDFLLYVQIQNSHRCKTEPSVQAFAAHCQTDTQGRPLAGTVVICREQLKPERYRHEALVQLLVHELIHVLGFSRTLFSAWRDCSHSHQADIGCVPHRWVTNLDDLGHMRIYTQSVVEALQRHLNSTGPQVGGPLENWDADIRGLSSHWEARVLQGSIMAATLGEPSTVELDQITLAALQDTGWYSVNISQSQSLIWGRGEGSHFGALSTCNDITSRYFCSGRGLGCHYHHLHKGECQSDPYLDGCRIYKPQIECWIKKNESDNVEWSGEIYQSDSRCFFSNLTRESFLRTNTSHSLPVAGHCYRHRCTGIPRYQIQVMDADWLDCPPGSAIEIPGYIGVLFCPEKILCSQSDHTNLLNNQHHEIVSSLSSSPTDMYYPEVSQTAPDPDMNFDTDLSKPVAWDRAKVVVPALLIFALVLSLIIAFRATYKVFQVRARVHAEGTVIFMMPLH